MTNADRWALICETEDALCEADVFYNGFTNRRKANPDSYGTCVDFAKLDAWLAQTVDAARLGECVAYWLENPNVQPPLRMVAYQAKRFLEKIAQ